MIFILLLIIAVRVISSKSEPEQVIQPTRAVSKPTVGKSDRLCLSAKYLEDVGLNRLREFLTDTAEGLRYSEDSVRLSYTEHVYLVTGLGDWAGYNERRGRIKTLGYVRILAVL